MKIRLVQYSRVCALSFASDSVIHGLFPIRVLSVNELSQTRILEWVASFFSRGSSPPRDQTCVSCIGKWIFLPTVLYAKSKYGLISNSKGETFLFWEM